MKTKTRYKFLRTGYKSNSGVMAWKVGRWHKHDAELELCKSGFHCPKGIYQAFSFVQGEILAQVEVRGNSIVEKDKEVWNEMRIIKSWKWTKKDSVLFSIYAARLVLKDFESVCPNDDRPRKAIEAAERYVKNPTEENCSAARSVAESAAESARFAWSAASACCAAWSAVRSAESAWSAAESAESAARSAAASAWSAAASAASAAVWAASWAAAPSIYKKLDKWMLEHTKEMRVLKDVTNLPTKE